MKLRIELANQHESLVYSSTDVVTGVISLHIARSLSISRLEINIEGRLRASEPVAINGEYPALPTYHTIIKTSQTLFPRFPLSQTRYTLGKGRHDYSFGIDLSLLLCYVDRELLDSDLNTRQSLDPTRVFYTVRATVRGLGCLRLQRSKTMNLTSVRLDAPNIPWLSTGTRPPWQSCHVLPFDIKEQKLELPPGKGDFLPVYRPALVVRAAIDDGFRPLHFGDCLGLRLWISSSACLTDQLDIRLRSIRLSLIDLTIPRARESIPLDHSSMEFATRRMDFPLKPKSGWDHVEIDSCTWRSCELPGFAAIGDPKATEGHEHLLQVLCEFSWKKALGNTFASVLIPVSIVIGDNDGKNMAAEDLLST